MSSREMRQAVEKMLSAKGVRHRFLGRRGKHPSIEIHTGAGARRFFIPGTPGGPRSVSNPLAMLKRAIRRAP